MSNNVSKPGIRGQTRDALNRILDLEQSIPQLVAAVNKAVNTVRNQIGHLAEQVDAVVSILGEETIVKSIQDNRVAKLLAETESRKNAIQASVDSGVLKVVDEVYPIVTDETGKVTAHGPFIEGAEFDAEGKPMLPGWVFLRLSELHPETQESLIGKKAGDSVPTFKTKSENGNNIVIKDESGKPELSGGKFSVFRLLRAKTAEEVAAEKADAAAEEAMTEDELQSASESEAAAADAVEAAAEAPSAAEAQ